MQMHRNMCQMSRLSCQDSQIVTKSIQKLQNLCLVLSTTKVPVYKPSLMRQGGVLYKHIVLHVLQPMGIHSQILKSIAKIKTVFKKMIRHGWTQTEVHP